MLNVEKHRNFEEELLEVCEDDPAKFELLSLHIEWALQRFDELDDLTMQKCEVRHNVYMIQINKSFTCDIGVKVLFRYEGNEVIVALSAKGIN